MSADDETARAVAGRSTDETAETTEGGPFFERPRPVEDPARGSSLSLAPRETFDVAPDVAALAFARDHAKRDVSAQELALSALHAAIKALPGRLALPCWAGSLPVGWWTSDDRFEREAAAELCVECPVVVDCRAAGDAGDEPAGVWGGVDRVPRPRKPGRKPKC